jgi:hypothetical protein
MQSSIRSKQRGFASPVIFLAVALGFVGTMGIETPEGASIASSLGAGSEQKSEFAAFEEFRSPERE